jgi:hypothetical protein
MNARGALVGFLLAGFAVLALSSLTQGAKEDALANVTMQPAIARTYPSIFPHRTRERSMPPESVVASASISEGVDRRTTPGQ